MNKNLTIHSDTHPQMSIDEAYSLATDHLNAQRYSEAYQLCNSIIQAIPTHIEAINLLGVIAQKIGRHDLAAEQFENAININGNIPNLYFNLGTSLLPLGRNEEAIACYKKAISIQPNNPEFHYNLANVYKSVKRFDDAILHYKQAITIKPDFVDAHFHLGCTLTESENFDEAIFCFQKVLALKPDFPAAQHLLDALTGNTSDRAPKEYVKGVFNSYADNFEIHLLKTLEYKTPSVIKEAILNFGGAAKRFNNVLDVGCGTGLMGVEIRDISEKLIGIDLSENMVQLAAKKSVYDELHVYDAIEGIQALDSTFDLIIASDVFVYSGDLEPIFKCVSKYFN